MLRIRRLNKFLLVTAIGFAVHICVGAGLFVFRVPEIFHQGDKFLNSLAVNMLSNTFFFVLVGLAGVLAQFYGERGDVLQQRLRRVFANKRVSLPVIDFFDSIAKANAAYAARADHSVTVLEFRPDIFAHRG